MHQAILERCYETLAWRRHSCGGARPTLRIVVGMRLGEYKYLLSGPRAQHSTLHLRIYGSQISGRHTTEDTHRRAVDSSWHTLGFRLPGARVSQWSFVSFSIKGTSLLGFPPRAGMLWRFCDYCRLNYCARVGYCMMSFFTLLQLPLVSRDISWSMTRGCQKHHPYCQCYDAMFYDRK